MRECKRCLYRTTHPFGLTLNEAGVCSGCLVHEEKTRLDWSKRLDILAATITRHPKRSKFYDCVVPVRGTPEHFILLDILVNDLGLRPLLVAYNTQFNSRAGIRNVDLMRDAFDLDVEIYVSNPNTYRKLVRESLARLDSVRWPLLAGTTQFPVRTAVDKSIPIVVWPYHQPTEQVGTHSYSELNEMSRRDRHEFDLVGSEPNALLTTETLIRRLDIEDLQYPSDREIEKMGVRGLYMANYVPWDSRLYSERAIEQFGAIAAENPRTYDPYDRIDDMVYMTAHDLLKEAKLGYSRVTDTLCQEIRFGRIERDVAMEIAQYFSSDYPGRELGAFLDWIGVTEDAFRWILQRLPHGEKMLEQSKTHALSKRAQTFVNGFQRGSAVVHETASFTVFGKGLEISS